MKALYVFNYVVWALGFGFALWVGFGDGALLFGTPVTTMLIATTALFAWTALSIAFVLPSFLEAEPGSMTYADAQLYGNAFMMPATIAFLFALAFGIRFWTTSTYGPVFLFALTVLVIVAFALMAASTPVSTRLQKPEPATEPAAHT